MALAALVFLLSDALTPITASDGAAPFRTALAQLGILYIIALFVERSLEVLIKAWRQGGKSALEHNLRTAAATAAEDPAAHAEADRRLQAYRAGTQRRALLVALTLGIMVALSGVRLLGPIFDPTAATAAAATAAVAQPPFQQDLFHFTDILLTAGLIAGGSATLHELLALIDDFLRSSRTRAKPASPLRGRPAAGPPPGRPRPAAPSRASRNAAPAPRRPAA